MQTLDEIESTKKVRPFNINLQSHQLANQENCNQRSVDQGFFNNLRVLGAFPCDTSLAKTVLRT